MRSFDDSSRNLTLDCDTKELIECEAVGCNAKATTTIPVPVGKKGTISVLLCQKCISKFESNYQKEIGETSKERRISSSRRSPEILQDASTVGSPQKRLAAVTSKTTVGEDTSGR
jgi:hypothetical protein